LNHDYFLMTTFPMKLAGFAAATAFAGLLATASVANAEPVDPSTPQTQVIVPAPTDGTAAVSSGQKMKVKGVVTRRDADTFTVRDMNGLDTTV
jgi:hypothetical protein